VLGLFSFIDKSSGKINNQVADCRLDNDGEGPEARTGLLHAVTCAHIYIYIYIRVRYVLQRAEPEGSTSLAASKLGQATSHLSNYVSRRQVPTLA